MIIFDLDGTLADCRHRRHFVEVHHPINENQRLKEISLENTLDPDPNGYSWKPNWKKFFDACDKDTPILATKKIFDSLSRCSTIEIWSGRCESVKEKTVDWICKNLNYDFYSAAIPIIKMRPIGDSTPDDQLKEKWLDEAISKGKKIEAVFDDRPKVIRMWQRRGIFVFNCNQTDDEF